MGALKKQDVEQEEEKKKKYRVQIGLGILGGLILVVFQVSGSALGLRTVINYFVAQNLLSEQLGDTIHAVLDFFVLGGGVTVICGSLLLGSKLRSVGSFLINIGAGVSLINLVLRIVEYAPQIQVKFLMASESITYLSDAIKMVGFGIGFVGLGVLLAFLATFDRLKWPLSISVSAFIAMFSGLVADPVLFRVITNFLNLTGPTVDYLLNFMYFYGAFLLIVAILYGLGWRLVAKILLLIGIVLALTTMTTILLTLIHQIGTVAFLSYPVIYEVSRLFGLSVVAFISGYVFIRG